MLATLAVRAPGREDAPCSRSERPTVKAPQNALSSLRRMQPRQEKLYRSPDQHACSCWRPTAHVRCILSAIHSAQIFYSYKIFGRRNKLTSQVRLPCCREQTAARNAEALGGQPRPARATKYARLENDHQYRALLNYPYTAQGWPETRCHRTNTQAQQISWITESFR